MNGVIVQTEKASINQGKAQPREWQPDCQFGKRHEGDKRPADPKLPDTKEGGQLQCCKLFPQIRSTLIQKKKGAESKDLIETQIPKKMEGIKSHKCTEVEEGRARSGKRCIWDGSNV